jgi:ubiquinone/menaquinone biosynthesis C-methylase UbiE
MYPIFPDINKSREAVTAEDDGSQFESLYLAARLREQRIYSDDELLRLPGIESYHPHYREWKIRKKSSQSLISFLASQNRKMAILEIGCGNGWLSHQLSGIRESEVWGSDINQVELEQASRVFSGFGNLKFIEGDIRENLLTGKQFDVIVLAASIQYFPTLHEVMTPALRRLARHGEIHIIDSHFYESAALEAARKRTREYYSEMGLPQMAERYFHHALEELEEYSCKMIYDPSSRMQRLRIRHPFPWIRINNPEQ